MTIPKLISGFKSKVKVVKITKGCWVREGEEGEEETGIFLF